MIDGKSVLGVIIARGGSKGLPGKNLADLGGKPLIAWSVEAGKASRHIDRLIISSDDAAIIETAVAHGCEAPFVRDPSLASDAATGTEVVVDAVRRLPGYDYVVLLQATSPLRAGADIDDCLEHCAASGAPCCVTVTALEKPLEWLMTRDDAGRLSPVTAAEVAGRRQDAVTVFAPNGAVYAAETDWLIRTGGFYSDETVSIEIPRERAVDIDTADDLALARFLLTESTPA